LKSLVEDKKSILCVSIDPALPRHRERFVIPEKYLKNAASLEEAYLNFILDIIDSVCDYAVLVKFNIWYVFPLSYKNLKYIVQYSHRRNLLTILDCKINDITDTVNIGLQWIKDIEFDCVTFNPLPGNLCNVVEICKKLGIGVLVLTLMSNKESIIYFKESMHGGRPLFTRIAEQVKECDADGCVVGVTGHVDVNDIKTIRKIVGSERVLFLVGVGAQGGQLDKVRAALPGVTVVNVGRDIIYAENVRDQAEYYRRVTWNIIHEFLQEP